MGVESAIAGISSVSGAVAVDLSSADYAPASTVFRGIYVGVSGDVKVDLANGDTVTFVGLAAGIEHAIAAKKIYKTGTTATSILALK